MCIGMRYACVSQWLRVLTPIKTKVFRCHVLVVRRNISSTTADGKLAEYSAVVRVKCDMEQLEIHSSLTQKQGMVPRSASELWDA